MTKIKSKEKWRDVPGYKGIYQASTLGRVRSLDRTAKGRRFIKGKILSEATTIYGYKTVCLCKFRKCKQVRVHKIIALSFLGKRPKGMQIEHIDHSKNNNKPENLRYCTASENMARSKKDNIVAYGLRMPQSKITEKQAEDIIKNSVIGDSAYYAKKYKITQDTVRKIRRGKLWERVFIRINPPMNKERG